MTNKETTTTATDNTIFNKSFMGKLRRSLEASTHNGETISREKLCEELGLDTSFSGMISALVNSGVVEGYEIRRGPYGGIGKVGEKRPPGSLPRISRPKKSEMFDPAFLEKVKETLETLTEEDPTKYIRRVEVARAMGMPGSDVEAAISLSLNSGKIEGYESRRGMGGGIRRIQPEGVEAESEVESEEEIVEPEVMGPQIFVKPPKKGLAKTKGKSKEHRAA